MISYNSLLLFQLLVGVYVLLYSSGGSIERLAGDNIVEIHSLLAFLVDSCAQLPNSRI
jgi:hypothetical protein